VFDVRLTDNFHYQSQFVETENITWRDQKKNVQVIDKHVHTCQPLWFFRNCYEFWAKITVLWSTVYWLRIFDYCRPGTVPHLNIIVII